MSEKPVKKGNRVKLDDGRLGVVIKGGRVIQVALDGTFHGERYSVVNCGLQHVSLSNEPLPEEAFRPSDDPTLPYTIKFVPNGGVRMGDDSEIFCLDILKDGKKIGVQASDSGWGGGIHIEGENPEFEAAVKEWFVWINADKRFDPIETWVSSWIYEKDYPANMPWKLKMS